MFWPTELTSVQVLPELPNLKAIFDKKPVKGPENAKSIEYQPSPEKDPIIGSVTQPVYTESYKKHYARSGLHLPYAILTYRGLYLYDSRTGSPISAHIRSDNSIAKYGSNVKVRVSPCGRIFAVETSGNVALIYTIRTDLSDHEMLTVFNSDGFVLQNGLPLPRYRVVKHDETYEDSGLNLDEGTANGFVQSLLKAFKPSTENETPVTDFGLRLRLILNVQSRLADFFFLSDLHIILVNKSPTAFQVVPLGKDKKITYLLAENLTWYPEEDRNADIIDFHYNYALHCFCWVNSLGKCWLAQVGKSRDITLLEPDALTGTCLYSGSEKAVLTLISNSKGLVYVGLHDGRLLLFKIGNNGSSTLLKTINKPPNAGQLRHFSLSPDENTLIIQYSDGWTIHSFLGNLNFSTFEFDPLLISSPNDIRFIDYQNILLTHADKILRLKLSGLNFMSDLSSLAVNRPILFSADALRLFCGSNRSSAPDTLKSASEETLYNESRFADSWMLQTLPLAFTQRNSQVRASCANKRGTFFCVVGEKDVIVFDCKLHLWKFLDWKQEDILEQSASGRCHAFFSCLWYQDYLILSAREEVFVAENAEDPTFDPAVYVFPPSCLKSDAEFKIDSTVWNFKLPNAGKGARPNIISVDLDLSQSTLIVTTNEMSIYTWKICEKSTDSVSNVRALLIFEKLSLYQLKDAFKELDNAMCNVRSVLLLRKTDLLILDGTSLFIVSKQAGTAQLSKYHISLVNNQVEYVQKLDQKTFLVFDGSKILHYSVIVDDLSSGTNLGVPVNINIGNEVESLESGSYDVESSGVTPYPLTTQQSDSTVYGVEVECYSDTKIRLVPTKKNYLDDIIDHQIWANIRVRKSDSMEALGITTVYRKMHKLPHFKYVLELLMVRYIQHVYEKKLFDSEDEYFDRLFELIKMTGKMYEILLNCLKKTEAQYWNVLFEKLGENARDIVGKLLHEDQNYKLSAHYLIIALNGEKHDDKLPKDGIESWSDTKLKAEDALLFRSIVQKLASARDYVTCFEMLHFLKLVDPKACTEVIKSIE